MMGSRENAGLLENERCLSEEDLSPEAIKEGEGEENKRKRTSHKSQLDKKKSPGRIDSDSDSDSSRNIYQYTNRSLVFTTLNCKNKIYKFQKHLN